MINKKIYSNTSARNTGELDYTPAASSLSDIWSIDHSTYALKTCTSRTHIMNQNPNMYKKLYSSGKPCATISLI